LRNIIIFGSGGHAKVVIDIIEKSDKMRILGIADDNRSLKDKVYGYQILNGEFLTEIRGEIYGGIIAIGDNWARKETADTIKKIYPNFNFVAAIHPSAVINSEVMIGKGTVVMGGVVVNSYSTIGDHCIVNTSSSIDHDCTIGDFASIAPGATLGGNVKIGKYSAISLGSNVIHSVEIGDHTVIGAGSTVVKNIDSYKVAYGAPAKVIRNRAKGEKYLSRD
jgi:sugar O-acyltransferase (sialic acid O-acetyltransferase NeuD family)